jgi:hypothetical protein
VVVSIDRHAELDLFGIGTTLREARERRGLTLANVERETCIRAANLAAIEEERFDDLPGDVYAAGFIRSYASLLELDGDRYAERFWELRHAASTPTLPPLLRRDTRRLPISRGALLAAVVAVLVAGLAIAAARRYGADAPAPAEPAATSAPVPHAPALALRATGGRTWVAVRLGSPGGKLLWAGTLHRDGKLRFGLGRPVWVGIGRPGRVAIVVGDRHVRVAPSMHRLLFSADGVRRG